MNKKVYCYVFKENERFYGGWTRWEGDEAMCRIGSTHRWRLDTGSGDGEREGGREVNVRLSLVGDYLNLDN